MVNINLNMGDLGRYSLQLKKGTYSGGKLALRLVDNTDGAPFATLTVNLPNHNHLLEEGEFFIKTWAENNTIVEALRKADSLFTNTGRKVEINRGIIAEIWKFKDPNIINTIVQL